MTYRKLGQICATIFLVLVFMDGSRTLVERLIGSIAQPLGLVSMLLAPVTLVLAVLCYEKNNRPASKPLTAYVVIFMLLLFGLGGLGWLNANPGNRMVKDFISYFIIVLGLIAGRRNEFWDDLRWPVLITGSIAILLGFAFTDFAVVEERGILSKQAGYRVLDQMYMIPAFAVLSSRLWGARYRQFAMGAIVLDLGLHLLFLKRSLFVFIALHLFLAIWLQMKQLNRRTVAGFSALLLVLIIVAAWLPSERAMGKLSGRFEGKRGFVSQMTGSNQRLLEAHALIKDFNSFEMLIGRGLGGEFYDSSIRGFVLEGGPGKRGRPVVHIGLMKPILKGGIILFLACYGGLFFLCFQGAGFDRNDKLSHIVVPLAILVVVFLTVTGGPNLSARSLYMGLLMGRLSCISKKSAQ